MTDWPSLLSSARLQDSKPPMGEAQRTPFQRDFDRVAFSSHFRRLQDKTQVHPLADSDYVRRRLTHSLEVSCVARSLGTFIGRALKNRGDAALDQMEELAAEVGQIAAAAALAHDIGNPPFGHIGETAIAEWFETNSSNELFKQLSPAEMADLRLFEGNAQGFRILVRLANSHVGLKLTAATLGAFTKYPTSSSARRRPGYIGQKKHGFFCAESTEFAKLAWTLGLRSLTEGSWQRHPLAFLVEAADDICYRIIDVEDGVKVGRIEYRDAEACLRALLPGNVSYNPSVDDKDSNLGWLRATAIGNLIEIVQQVFLENEASIVNGEFGTSLIEGSPLASAVEDAKKLVEERVFKWDRTIRAEISGVKMLHSLLDDFINAAAAPQKASGKKLLAIVPGYDLRAAPYEQLLSITDFISGMTDSYLVETYQQVHGVAVP
ncbi:deoxyguanosinetriphosphate triphosphohydrolase [Reyranella sp.]|uniref:deoxyguanosinetriphosphate triphosphohydrolase n=1 Tax=Reyranella sp. TaxID=1929291 RepID=UPI003BA88C9A